MNNRSTLMETNLFLRGALRIKGPTYILDINVIRHFEKENDIFMQIALKRPNFLDILDDMFFLDAAAI